MGVDALFGVVPKEDLSNKEVLELSYRLAEAIGYDYFFIDRENGIHAITKQDDGSLRVNAVFRYYGPGYERGPWPLIAGVLEWLRRNIDGTVVYGDDSSYKFIEVTDEFMDEMWSYFAEKGHHDYFHYGATGKVMCDFCRKPMTPVGWSYGKTLWLCHGCGYKTETEGVDDI